MFNYHLARGSLLASQKAPKREKVVGEPQFSKDAKSCVICTRRTEGAVQIKSGFFVAPARGSHAVLSIETVAEESEPLDT